MNIMRNIIQYKKYTECRNRELKVSEKVAIKMVKRAAIAGSLLLLSVIAVSGCSKKYEEITLPAQESSLTDGESSAEESFAGTGTASQESPLQGADGITLDVGEPLAAAEAADGEAVAGTSPLESELTTANGFTDTDENVYVLDNLVNIRSGCGTEYSIVTQLNKGDSLKRTGYSDGWSRVLYKDKVCYVLSEYVSTEDPAGQGTETLKALGAAADEGLESPSGTVQREMANQVVSNGVTVAIDAGHQAKGNSEKEPIGPGSSTMKAKVASGTEGVSTKLPEYKLTLEVSKKVKRILEERGYKVVMIRESNDVNLSNAERAEIANKSGASIFVRIHANSLDNSTVRGTLAMCQTEKNPYNGELHAQSYSLSKKITDGICSATGFKNRGVQETDTMSGINWCEIPVSIVEMGFMSNPEEDELMSQDEYQEKIATGIANGIDAYYGV